MFQGIHLVVLVLGALAPSAMSRTNDAKSALSNGKSVAFDAQPHEIIEHSQAKNEFDKSYHYDTVDPLTGESDIFTIRLAGNTDDTPTDLILANPRDKRTVSLSNAKGNSHLENRASPNWICTFTVGCYRSAVPTSNGQGFNITTNQGNAAAQQAANYIGSAPVFQKYRSGQLVRFSIKVSSSYGVYWIMVQVQALEIGTTDTCKAQQKGPVRTATHDEIKLFTYAGTQNLQAGDARGKTYRHQAENTHDLVENTNFPAQLGEAFVVAVNVSPKQGDFSQPVVC